MAYYRAIQGYFLSAVKAKAQASWHLNAGNYLSHGGFRLLEVVINKFRGAHSAALYLSCVDFWPLRVVFIKFCGAHSAANYHSHRDF